MVDDTEDVKSSIRVPILLHSACLDQFYDILSRFHFFGLTSEASTRHSKIGVVNVGIYKLTI